MKYLIFLLVTTCAIVLAQNDGRYRPAPRVTPKPFTFTQQRPVTTFTGFSKGSSAGRYRPSNDGRYVDNSGRYTGSSDGRYVDSAGRYRGSSDGRYNPANDGRYIPDTSGTYKGTSIPYTHLDNPDAGYSGKNDPYKHDAQAADKYVGSRDKFDNDRYRGDKYQGDKYKGDGSSNAGGGGAGAAAGAKKPTFGSIGTTGLNKPGTKGSDSDAGGKRVGSGKPVGSGAGARPYEFTGVRSGAGESLSEIDASLIGPNGESLLGLPKGLTTGSAAGKYDNKNYRIITQVHDYGKDKYHFDFETENGIFGEEDAVITNQNTDAESKSAKGYYLYTGPDNVVYRVDYTAGEEGFIPSAAHIPTPPPIPKLIQRALDYKRSIGEI